jgi:hypothetical protein
MGSDVCDASRPYRIYLHIHKHYQTHVTTAHLIFMCIIHLTVLWCSAVSIPYYTHSVMFEMYIIHSPVTCIQQGQINMEKETVL